MKYKVELLKPRIFGKPRLYSESECYKLASSLNRCRAVKDIGFYIGPPISGSASECALVCYNPVRPGMNGSFDPNRVIQALTQRGYVIGNTQPDTNYSFNENFKPTPRRVDTEAQGDPL